MKTKSIIVAALLLFCQSAFASWTAIPTSKSVVNGTLVISVDYVNGASKFTRSHTVNTYEQFKQEVSSEIKRLDGIDADIAKVIVGTPVSVTPAVPTQAETDRIAFVALYQDWQKKKASLDSGLSKTVSQGDVDAAFAAAVGAYKEEYVVLLGRL